MANRNVKNIKGMKAKETVVHVRSTTGTSPTIVDSKGGATSVVNSGNGALRITLDDTYKRVLAYHADLRMTGTAPTAYVGIRPVSFDTTAKTYDLVTVSGTNGGTTLGDAEMHVTLFLSDGESD